MFKKIALVAALIASATVMAETTHDPFASLYETGARIEADARSHFSDQEGRRRQKELTFDATAEALKNVDAITHRIANSEHYINQSKLVILETKRIEVLEILSVIESLLASEDCQLSGCSNLSNYRLAKTKELSLIDEQLDLTKATTGVPK
jgi:hypothetical protein